MGREGSVKDQAQRLRELARKRAFTGYNTVNKKIPDNQSCKSIAVTSGKGGVGKTNIALFFAVILAQSKKRVLLLDADLGLANVHILLGIAPKYNISHFLEGECSLNHIIYKNESAGFDIIPGASGMEKLANLDRGRLEFLQHEFFKLEQNYDYIIIDTGAGIGSVVTRFASKADVTVVVMTPEPTSLSDAYAMIKVLNEKQCSKIGVIINMAGSDRNAVEIFDRLNTIVLKFLKKSVEIWGILPINKDIPRYVRKQSVFVLDKPYDQFSKRTGSIVRKVSGISCYQKQGFFARFLSSGI